MANNNNNKRIHGEGGDTDSGDAAVKRARREQHTAENSLSNLPREMRGVIQRFLPLASVSALARASRLHYAEFWPAVARDFERGLVETRAVAPALAAFIGEQSRAAFERALLVLADDMADLFLDHIYDYEVFQADFSLDADRNTCGVKGYEIIPGDFVGMMTYLTRCKLVRCAADAALQWHVPLVQLAHRWNTPAAFRHFGIDVAPALVQRNARLGPLCAAVEEAMALARCACARDRDRLVNASYEHYAVQKHLARLFSVVLLEEAPTAVACSVYDVGGSWDCAHMVGLLATNAARWTREFLNCGGLFSNVFDTPQNIWLDYCEEEEEEEEEEA